MSIQVAAVPAGSSAQGWQVQSLLGTPLGSSYMPRALDIEPALLGGRLQRMEDTTKIYKGLVRQGLGWAKVFQRVQYLTRFDFAEYFLETRERELSVAMYEAAARDFLSKYADGDIIKLRLLQSNEFRECLEKYGAALNAGVCRNFSLAYGKLGLLHPGPSNASIRFFAGTYAYHTRTGVFELALPDTPQPAAALEDKDDKRQLKRQYRVFHNRHRLCVNNYGSLPSAAEAQELLTHARRRSQNRRRGQRTEEEEAHAGAAAPVGGVKRPRKAQRASTPASPGAAASAGGQGGAAACVTAMQLQQLAQLHALQQLAIAQAHAQVNGGGHTWEAMQEAMRGGGGLTQPAVWGGMPVMAASALPAASTAGAATTAAVAWPATSAAPQQWSMGMAPQLAYMQAVAQMQGAAAAQAGWAAQDATAAAAGSSAVTPAPAAAPVASPGTFGTPQRASTAVLATTPNSLPPAHSPQRQPVEDDNEKAATPAPRATTKRAQAAAAKKAAAVAAAAAAAQERAAVKAAKAAQRQQGKAAAVAAAAETVWSTAQVAAPATTGSSGTHTVSIPLTGVVAAEQAATVHPALAAQWMAAAAAQANAVNPMYYALAAQQSAATDASVTADSSSWPGLSVTGVFAGMPVAQAAVAASKPKSTEGDA